jgi:hypothetical protein
MSNRKLEDIGLTCLTIAGNVTLLPAARLAVVVGAGHMGPLTHAAAVSQLIAAHIRSAESAMHLRHGCRSGAAAARHDGLQSLSGGVS